MALMKEFGSNYTKTGSNFLMRLSNMSSFIPFFGAGLATFFGAFGTAWDAAGWLFRGKISSALTAAGTGAAATITNATIAGSAVGIAANVGSYIATGKGIGTHSRKLTEIGIGGVSGIVGVKPQVLSSYTAGIGSIGGGAVQSGPGRFASQVSSERGQDANAAYSRYMAGEGGVHVNELQSANSRGM